MMENHDAGAAASVSESRTASAAPREILKSAVGVLGCEGFDAEAAWIEENLATLAIAPDMLAELQQCATELGEAAKLLFIHFPQIASVYAAASDRTSAAIAKATEAA